MPVKDYEYDGDPNGVILGDQGDRCFHKSKNETYQKTGGTSRMGWVKNVTEDMVPAGTLQVKTISVDTLVTSSALLPVGDVPANISQGDQLLSYKITPKEPTSTVMLTFSCAWASTVMHQDAITFALFRVGLGDALAQVQLGCPSNTQLFQAFLQWPDKTGSLAEITYQVRFGRGGGSGTVSVNGPLAGRRGGGKQRALLLMQEFRAI